MSERSQVALVWWALIFTAIYGVALGVLLDMIPPPTPKLSADEIAQWYSNNHDQVRLGAVVASWTSAFMIPLVIVLTIQAARIEAGRKVWSLTIAIGGAMMSIFLVLPPLFFGVAAFTEDRTAEVTALMHELGVLTLTTTDQYYIFMWIAVVVIALRPTTMPFSPFPRWYGYFTLWTALMFEAGAIAFLPREGPFAWRGLLVFWSPLSLFGGWILVTSILLLRALKAQRLAGESEETPPAATEPALA